MQTMAGNRDYYKVLGVDRSASEKEIADAYWKLALEYHPDRNPGDEEAVTRFREAAEAFEVLSHSDKRARYDRFGLAGLEGGEPQFRDVGDIFEAFGDLFGEGLFGDLFGGGRTQDRRVRQGADVRCEVVLDLPEATKETTKTVRFERHRVCSTCGGTGAKPGTQPETCRNCGGRGRMPQSTGIFSTQTTCPSCRGNGVIIHAPCHPCRGSGHVRERVTREVKIPPGVDNGTRLRLQGEGDPRPTGGPPGDCYCIITIRDHPLFHRDGRDLICQIPITCEQAALGTTIEVPTLDGSEQLEIRPGTQSGDVFRLAGHGMPTPRHRGRGDMVVEVHIEVRKSFFSKLKEYFRSG